MAVQYPTTFGPSAIGHRAPVSTVVRLETRTAPSGIAAQDRARFVAPVLVLCVRQCGNPRIVVRDFYITVFERVLHATAPLPCY